MLKEDSILGEWITKSSNCDMVTMSVETQSLNGRPPLISYNHCLMVG